MKFKCISANLNLNLNRIIIYFNTDVKYYVRTFYLLQKAVLRDWFKKFTKWITNDSISWNRTYASTVLYKKEKLNIVLLSTNQVGTALNKVSFASVANG